MASSSAKALAEALIGQAGGKIAMTRSGRGNDIAAN